MKHLVSNIVEALSLDLLSPEWKAKLKKTPSADITFGHCYIAAEAAYHLYGRQYGYVPQVISGPGWTHWYIKHPSGDIIDPTAAQFDQDEIPYDSGRGTGFLTSKPSKRCRELMRRVRRSNA